jgi:hypothetical protein
LLNLQVYYSEEVVKLPVIAIQGKCEVKKKKDLPALDNTAIFENLNDPENKAIKLVTKFPLLLHVLLFFSSS